MATGLKDGSTWQLSKWCNPRLNLHLHTALYLSSFSLYLPLSHSFSRDKAALSHLCQPLVLRACVSVHSRTRTLNCFFAWIVSSFRENGCLMYHSCECHCGCELLRGHKHVYLCIWNILHLNPVWLSQNQELCATAEPFNWASTSHRCLTIMWWMTWLLSILISLWHEKSAFSF